MKTAYNNEKKNILCSVEASEKEICRIIDNVRKRANTI